jgi:hypothetical protein
LGNSLLWAGFWNVDKEFGLLFPTVKPVRQFFTKNGFGNILRDFFPSNSSAQP